MLAETISQEYGTQPVTVLHVEGKLDGSNYESLVDEAQKLYAGGARHLVMDLERLTYLSSAGISALHRVALLFQGRQKNELEEGWHAFHAIGRDRDDGLQTHVKLLNPSQAVAKVLQMVGFDAYFEIYSEINQAVTSFQ
jgi:anti-anti-sigma regulatory factor